MSLALFNIGPVELLIMAAAAVMLFGGDLPATARKAARTVGRLRALASELGREFSADEHQLPKRTDFKIDMKRLTNLNDISDDKPPVLPGRREDEPIDDPHESPAGESSEADSIPAWRKSLASEVPPATGDEPTDRGSDAGPEQLGHSSDGETVDGVTDEATGETTDSKLKHED